MIKNLKNKVIKIGKYVCTVLFLLSTNSSTALATDFNKTKAVTGTVKLAEAASGAMIFLAPTVAGALVSYQFVKLKNAEDEGDEKSIRKKIKTILVAGIGVFVASGIITIVLGFYK